MDVSSTHGNSNGASRALEEWSFLGRRVLFVSTFRPNPDGIALYSDELLTALRPSGRTFVRLGIASGGGDRVRLLAGFTRPLWILVAARGVDDVVVM
jgi:hypothetical protein